MTTYTAVAADDGDVAAFLATQLDTLRTWSLPVAAWVARQDGAIVAVLAVTNRDYPAVHLLMPPADGRPFMRLLKLWRLAETWLRAHHIPLVAAPVCIELRHFQALLRRLGFRKTGAITDADGEVLEVVYAKELT